MKRKLVTVDAETLLATPMSKTMFIVDGLIPQGVNRKRDIMLMEMRIHMMLLWKKRL